MKPNRRQFLRSLAAVWGAAATVGCSFKLSKKKPNILFIFADDQAFETINAMGYKDVQTPNLDRLVNNGVSFTHAYNMGGWHGAICVASRTMLNTGRFLWDAHNVEPTLKNEVANGRFWSQYMKGAGYDTYMSGKWHIKGIDPNDIFDHVRDVRPGMPNQTPEGYNRPVEGVEDVWKPWDKSKDGFWKGGKHWSEVLGDHAVDYLNISKESNNPFFMYLAFNAPHDPRQSPKEYVDKYPLEKIKVPENYQPLYPNKEDIGLGEKQRDESLAPFPRTEYAVKVNRQEYYAIITHMDNQIGRILDTLEETGQANNTYIFFTADHGLSVGHHGLMGKQNMYDHSVRIPMMVNGPGINKRAVVNGAVYLQDVMATTLDLAGVVKPEHVQFNNLFPLLNGERQNNYDLIYGAYMNLQRMVSDGEYKLIFYPAINKKLLYNLKKDPQEKQNLADGPNSAEKLKDMEQKLLALQKQMNDPMITN